MFRHTTVSNCSQSFDMGTEVRPTNRKLHCYEMLSLQYLQSHEIDLWLELCRYLMGTPVAERKAISKQSNDTEDDQEDHEVEVISEEPEGQDIFVPTFRAPLIPIQLSTSLRRKLPNFCFDTDTWYLFILLKRNPFRLQKFIAKNSRPDNDFDHRNLLSSYLTTYNFTELHLDCLYRGPGDITPLPTEIFTCVNAKVLSLKNNYLESLPADIGRMSKLKKLYLTNNRIQNSGIPYTLQFLKELRELYLDNNLLDALPSFLLSMSSLRTVHRHGNHNYFKSTFMWYHSFTDINDRILEVPAVEEISCLGCALRRPYFQRVVDYNQDQVERSCSRCMEGKKFQRMHMQKQPPSLQYLCGLSLASGRINFYHGEFLPNRLKNQLSEQVTDLNLCGNCNAVKQIGDSGFKIFTFKNPYLGNTCVPFLHWACSYECAHAIEVPARKQQLSSAKEQDIVYEKYVRKSLEDLLQSKCDTSTTSLRSNRPRQRPSEEYVLSQLSPPGINTLRNEYYDNISISSGREIRSSGTSDRSANTLPTMSARPRILSENYEAHIAEQEQGEPAVFNSIHDGSQRSTDGATANQEFMTNDYPNTYELDYSSASSSTRECGVTSTCIIL